MSDLAPPPCTSCGTSAPLTSVTTTDHAGARVLLAMLCPVCHARLLAQVAPAPELRPGGWLL